MLDVLKEDLPAGYRVVFPANHQRYLFSRFRYIDELLGDAVHALDLTDETRLFPRAVRDATSEQRKILKDYLAQLRFALKRFIDTQQLTDATRSISGLWSLRTAIIFSKNAVAEMRPIYMAGYGALPPDAAEASERLVAELGSLLKRMEDYLDKGRQGDLAARLAHLEGTADEVSLLRELERVITLHGLVELRSTLESLTDRAIAPRYEVALFGRVNSGKSSLLNWWLERDLLPTGVTPVTAVPARIAHGAALKARIKIASLPWKEIPVAELGDYLTESSNPGNVKRVLELVLEVPSHRLSDGVYLIDTPGLGSLASAGAAQTLEYLPRCDLGIQLIEAGSAVGRDDLAISRALLDGGSDLVVALSKADRLAPTDLETSLQYVSDLYRRELGVAISVRPVSTVGDLTRLAQLWFDEELLPRLSSHLGEARRLLRRKIGALHETVVAVLTLHLERRPTSNQTDTSDDTSVHEGLARLRAELATVRADFLARAARVKDCSEWMLDGLCQTLLNVWTAESNDAADIHQRLKETVEVRASEVADVVSEGLTREYERLQRGLSELFPAEMPKLPRLRGRPPYDSEALPLLESYEPPFWGFARRLLTYSAKARITTRMLPVLTERLSTYGEALSLWGTRYLDELDRQLSQVSAFTEAKDRSRSSTFASSQSLAALERDLTRLKAWPQTHHRDSGANA